MTAVWCFGAGNEWLPISDLLTLNSIRTGIVVDLLELDSVALDWMLASSEVRLALGGLVLLLLTVVWSAICRHFLLEFPTGRYMREF